MGKNNYNQCILVYVFVWTISFVLPSSSSFAMKGDYLSKEKVPHSVCIVKTYNNICTGTLIDKDIVITAAHCIDRDHIKKPKKKLPIYVSCNGKSIRAFAMSYPSKDLSQSSSYYTKKQALVLDNDGKPNEALRRKWKYNNSDVALLKLKKKFPKITPQELVLSEESAISILNESVFCGLYGAGIDNREDIGRVRGIDYLPFRPDLRASEQLQRSQGYFFTTGKSQGIRPGDSGGPLSCLDYSGVWNILSIHQNLIPKNNWKGRSRATYRDEAWILDTRQEFESLIY